MGFLFYLLPIIYFAENIVYSARIPHRSALGHTLAWWLYHLYLLNPLAWIITAFKQIFFGVAVISNVNAPQVLYNAPFDWRYLLITTATSVGRLPVGLFVLQRPQVEVHGAAMRPPARQRVLTPQPRRNLTPQPPSLGRKGERERKARAALRSSLRSSPHPSFLGRGRREPPGVGLPW